MFKKLICKLFGHKLVFKPVLTFYVFIREGYDYCVRCGYKSSIHCLPPEHINCICTLTEIEKERP